MTTDWLFPLVAFAMILLAIPIARWLRVRGLQPDAERREGTAESRRPEVDMRLWKRFGESA